ncbi:hypothetical protein DL771_003146 [Monosporascus sp. 5C6A]|nr:hypothetical protein DL771_003146 [Monosporascus sp. 5C6A]
MSRPVSVSYRGRHSEFVQAFAAWRSQKKERPRVLSAEERAAYRQELSEIQHLQPALSEETKINISGALRRWIAQLSNYYALRPPNADGKEVVGLHAAKLLLVFNIARDTRALPYERRRTQTSAIYLFLGFTWGRSGELVNNERKRPQEAALSFGPAALRYLRQPDGDKDDEDGDQKFHLLAQLVAASNRQRGRPKALCYEDLLLTVVRDPETSKDVHILAVKLIHHKGEDRKPKPNVLIFCPVTHIVGLALDDNAFASPHLTNAERVFTVKNQAPAQCTPLRWKDDWLKKPISRQVDSSGVSPDEALLYHTLREDLKHQSLEACSVHLRRGPGGGSAPDAIRDQVMRHDPRWTTFFSAYLNMAVQWDLVGSALQTELQNKLISNLTQAGIWHDPRATRNMVPDEVWEEIEPDPEIMALGKGGGQLERNTYQITRQEYEVEDVEAEYRGYYLRNRPTWDIDKQFSIKAREAGEEYVAPVVDVSIPERAELARLLCNQPLDLGGEKIRERRIRVADLWSALCKKQEKPKRSRLCLRQRPLAVPVKKESPRPDPFPLLMEKTQCPDCIGNQGLTVEERTFSSCRPAVMNDHFEDTHLEAIERTSQRGGTSIYKHPKCKDLPPLTHIDHFRNHITTVHKVTLRSAQDAAARQEKKRAERKRKNATRSYHYAQ